MNWASLSIGIGVGIGCTFTGSFVAVLALARQWRRVEARREAAREGDQWD